MSDMPKAVTINEEGPREGFQIESGAIPTARKIELIEGGRMVEVLFPNGKRAPLPAMPLEMGEHRFTIRRQPPRKGEHSRAVLAEAGHTDVEIDELIEQGVVIAD